MSEQQYTITVTTNVPEIMELNGDAHFPDRQEAAMMLGGLCHQLVLLGFTKTDIVPFDPEAEQLHFKLELGDAFMEAHAYPRGEEVVPKKDLDRLFEELKAHLMGAGIEEVVLGVVDDVYKGVHRRNELLIPPLTVGDVRAIKGWWRTRWVIDEMVNASVGRSVRMAFINALGWSDERVAQEHDRILGMFAEIEAVQPQIVARLLEKTIAKYGDKPVDLEASKSAREKMMAFMEHTTGLKMDGAPGRYDYS